MYLVLGVLVLRVHTVSAVHTCDTGTDGEGSKDIRRTRSASTCTRYKYKK